MNRHEFEIYLELYKKKEFRHIPIGNYSNGDYFYCTEKQIQALELLCDDSTTSIGYGGSARSGKTVIEVVVIIFDCLAYDGIAWGLARKELTTLKRTALLTLFKQLSFYGIEQDKDFNYNQQLNKIVFNNGSEIFLIDTAYKPSDPLNTRFGGFELTRCAVDESNETAQEVIDKLFERTGWRLNEKYGLKRKLFECFNPAKNHVYTRFYKPFADNCQSFFRKFILALPSDNPNPAVAEWVKDLLADDKISEATKQRQIYGNFEYDDNPYSLFNYDDICNLFTNSFVKKTGQRYMSGDIAYMGADIFVTTIWDGFVIEKVIAIDKIDETAIGTKLIEMAEEYRIPFTNIVFDRDGLRKFTANSLSKLKGAKPFINNSAPLKEKNFKNLKAECAFLLKKKIEANEVFCEDKEFMKQIIFDLEHVCRVENNEGKIELESKTEYKKRTGKSFDFFDSIIMRMIFELKTTGKWK
jgi:hypothetical protein